MFFFLNQISSFNVHIHPLTLSLSLSSSFDSFSLFILWLPLSSSFDSLSLSLTSISMCRYPSKSIIYEFVLTPPALPSTSFSSYLHVMGVILWYNCSFVGCCFQFLFRTASSLHSSHITFSLSVLVESNWCRHLLVLTWLQFERISVLFCQRG